MNEFDIPIFKKTYDLFQSVFKLHQIVPKQIRYTLWQRLEDIILDILENIMQASLSAKENKLPTLDNASTKLNIVRVFIRLARDTKAIDNKKYVLLQKDVDEIGRMLGGWIRSMRSN